jgi:hypothetical protein
MTILGVSWSWLYANPDIGYRWKGDVKAFQPHNPEFQRVFGAQADDFKVALLKFHEADPGFSYSAWVILSSGTPLIHITSQDGEPATQRVLTFDIGALRTPDWRTKKFVESAPAKRVVLLKSVVLILGGVFLYSRREKICSILSVWK